MWEDWEGIQLMLGDTSGSRGGTPLSDMDHEALGVYSVGGWVHSMVYLGVYICALAGGGDEGMQ